MSRVKPAWLTAALLVSTAVARADVEISAKATSNMDCESGVCAATAQKAVLNVSDLQTMLASGDVAVKTGSLAKDIEIGTPLTWSSTARLTLDAQQSVTVKKQVTVAGQGALTVVTNDTGQPKAKDQTGEFIVVPERGSVQFWDLSSSLMIDGNSYTLVGDIKTLAADIAANPSGFYALAKPYDASGDGTYSGSPVATQFEGTFEGLGNYISNFAINVMTFEAGSGLFGALEKLGVVRELHLVRVKFSSGAGDTVGGSLVGANEGLVDRCSATGAMNPLAGAGFGGLVGASDGKIIHSYAVIQINASDMILGGLVGGNDGTITESYSEGSIRAVNGLETFAGGLVGDNTGTIRNTYSMSSVHNGRNDCCDLGGLVGRNEGVIVESYSAGKTSQGKRADRSFVGGLVGEDKAAPGSIASAYWDVDKGVTDPSQGAGNIKDDPGITGLTTVQFQAGLPGGFDPNVWAEDEHVNHGFPHLIYLHK